MTFLRSILLVTGVVASVSFALFAGHALSTHTIDAVLIGVSALAAGVILLFVYARTGRSAAPPARGGH